MAAEGGKLVFTEVDGKLVVTLNTDIPANGLWDTGVLEVESQVEKDRRRYAIGAALNKATEELIIVKAKPAGTESTTDSVK